MNNMTKLYTSALFACGLFSANLVASAKNLDVGMNVPNQLGQNFQQEAVNFDKFKGESAYLFVWDSIDKRLLGKLLTKTEETPAPIIVFCTGTVRTGSRRKDFSICKQQQKLLNNDRVTLIKKKKYDLDKTLKLPESNHLYVVNEQGAVIQKLKL
jgi:hypothetical protein